MKLEWLCLESRRLDLSFFENFTWTFYRDVNDGLLFKFPKECHWNWMRHAKKVTPIYSDFFFTLFLRFCLKNQVTECVHSCVLFLWRKKWDYDVNERILKIARVFSFGCSFCWLFVWFNLHEILVVDTKRKINTALHCASATVDIFEASSGISQAI